MDKFYIRQTSSNFNKIMEEIEKRGGKVCGNEKPASFESVGGIPCWGINVFGKACYASEGTFIKHGYKEIIVDEEQ